LVGVDGDPAQINRNWGETQGPIGDGQPFFERRQVRQVRGFVMQHQADKRLAFDAHRVCVGDVSPFYESHAQCAVGYTHIGDTQAGAAVEKLPHAHGRAHTKKGDFQQA